MLSLLPPCAVLPSPASSTSAPPAPPLNQCRHLLLLAANALHQKAIPLIRCTLLFKNVSYSRLFGGGGAALPFSMAATGGPSLCGCGAAQRTAERANSNSNTNDTAPSSATQLQQTVLNGVSPRRRTVLMFMILHATLLTGN
ncbi:hypothetical protein BDA96_06G239400 [Sorghum bicolor]|uniref:Uncharacterized protein n=1 Tax=Sorghum bicolor TaxID=4558 RepID=A0A921UDD3_SORBI|nr:hypothetical protein BDA96_06G239400 [Sorghum bicolor]